jgi:hypothetical protein
LEGGFTIEDPPEMLYTAAPEGLMVKVLPEQILPLFTLMVGVVNTCTEAVTGAETQPARVLVPVTV